MSRCIALLLIAHLFASAAQAEIHKCVANDGNVTYSQVPCPIEKSETARDSVDPDNHVVDCRWATAFASDVTRSMRAGLAPDAVFDLYGGAAELSPGTLNIINYVFRFRGNPNVSAERIKSLAHSMCEAGSLGDVRCELLPYGQDLGSNRCSPDAGKQATTTTTADNASEQCRKGACVNASSTVGAALALPLSRLLSSAPTQALLIRQQRRVTFVVVAEHLRTNQRNRRRTET